LQVRLAEGFLLFWAASTGSAVATAFGPRFEALKQHGRDFGLAFASAHLVPVGLIAWLCWIGATPATGVFVFIGIALAFTYPLALLSIRRLQPVLGRTIWWLVRTVAVNYITVGFWRHPLQGGAKHIIESRPFAILRIAGPILYFVALSLSTTGLGRARLARIRPSREHHRKPAARCKRSRATAPNMRQARSARPSRTAGFRNLGTDIRGSRQDPKTALALRRICGAFDVANRAALVSPAPAPRAQPGGRCFVSTRLACPRETSPHGIGKGGEGGIQALWGHAL